MQYTLGEVKRTIISSLEALPSADKMTKGFTYNDIQYTVLDIIQAIKKDTEPGRLHVIRALRYLNKEENKHE